VRAESNELHLVGVLVLPGVELLAEKKNSLPERAAGPGGAASLDLDDVRRDLDDAGIEVNRAAGGQVIRPAGAVHHFFADDVARRAKDVFGLHLLAVEDDGELRFHSDGGELDMLGRSALGLPGRLLLGYGRAAEAWKLSFPVPLCASLVRFRSSHQVRTSRGIEVTYPRSRCK